MSQEDKQRLIAYHEKRFAMIAAGQLYYILAPVPDHSLIDMGDARMARHAAILQELRR